MTITRTKLGFIYTDTFIRANSAAVAASGHDWDETVRGTQAMRIQDNLLDSNVSSGAEEVYQPGDGAATVVIPTGDTIVQINADMSLAGGDRCQIMLRTDEGVAGTGSEDAYLAFFDAGGAGLRIAKNLSGSVSAQDIDVFDVSNDKRGLRLILEDQGGTHVVGARVTGTVIADMDDLSVDFDGASVEITDSTSPIEATGDTTDFAILTVDDVHMKHYIIFGRGILITGLPTGWKLQVDSEAAVIESGGTATLDIDTLSLPKSDIKVLDGSDVQQDILSLTDDVWGGDEYNFSEDGEVTADASINALVNGEVSVVASVVVKQNGQVVAVASINAKFGGEVNADGSLNTKVNGQINVDGSINVIVNSQVQIPADVRVLQQNVIFVDASINAAIIENGEISVDGSIGAAQQSEAQITASVQVLSLQPGEVFVGATVTVIQRGQAQVAASVQPAFNGQQEVVGSVRVIQRINGQVFVEASIIVKHSGAIFDPVFEDNRVNLVEVIQPILWRD